MANNTMKTLTIGGKSYEIVDAAARDSIQDLQEQITVNQYSSISLLTNNWSEEEPYFQTITMEDVTLTPFSKIDLLPTVEQYDQLVNSGILLQVVNDNGTVTAYASGNKPEKDYEFKVLVTETIFKDAGTGEGIYYVTSDTFDSKVTPLENKVTGLETSVQQLSKQVTKTSNIIQDNLKARKNITASAKHGFHKNGKANQDKRFCALMTTDVHRDTTRLQNAINFLGGMDAIDCGFNLGDSQGSSYSENDGTWYTNIVNKSAKPFYTLLGNHDTMHYNTATVSGTAEEAFNKMIKPTLGVMGMTDLTTPYYKILLDDYKIAIVCLNNFDGPSTKNSDGTFVVRRDAEALSQTQVNWFINALNEIPSGYHLMVMRHSYPASHEVVNNGWSQTDYSALDHNTLVYDDNEIVPDIVNAWINGTSFSKTYTPMSSYSTCPTLTVNANYSSRGAGVFIGHVVGHSHKDMICKSSKYSNQNIISFCATACDNWQNFCLDLPRDEDTGTQDAITTIAIDTSAKKIHLVRIGSDITFDLTKREYTTITY